MCFSVVVLRVASPKRLSPNSFDRPAKTSWPREVGRLHRSGCLAHVESPAPARGLKLSGRADSVSTVVPAKPVEQAVEQLRALRLSRRRLFFRSMICTQVVQAKPRPGYTSSTNPLSVFGPVSALRRSIAGAHPLARALAHASALCVVRAGEKAMSATGPSPCSTFSGAKTRTCMRRGLK